MPIGAKGMQTKKRVLTCALRIMSEQGIPACSIKQICKEADISVGAFYYHFATKEQILYEVIRQLEIDLLTALKRKKNATPKERIEYIVSFMLKHLTQLGVENSAWLLERMLNERLSEIAPDKYAVCQVLREEINRLQAEKQRAASADATTTGLIQMIVGTVYAWCYRMGEFDLVRQGLSATELVLGTTAPDERCCEGHYLGAAAGGMQRALVQGGEG